ncbi:coatomer epsilon subunit-domain-containing protein [Polychytrium aggregatum]|uniref:coatomer epsilon subunit-domain-containing protein n=1 Tax=Polychytrium aggregatum TaxID=110093 RepID=UPI0022FE4769|nr:coatomer epsilon subunit-domain-containing protein [Polychytrium aggregatum]KAI9193206.1 coatomer epsilon subunit-domain-containing protein [Polychytrium aggregatum]
MADPALDEILPIRNLFYLGDYQKVVNEATNPHQPRTEQARLLRRVFLYRAYLAQKKYNMVISEIAKASEIELRAIGTIARYFITPAAQRDQLVAEMKALADESLGLNVTVQILAATLFFAHGLLDDALRLVAEKHQNLECIALTVQAYLKLDRPNLALQAVQKMKAWAEDDVLAQLIESWVNLYIGGPERTQESVYTFEELVSSKGPTAKLLNSQAVSKMTTGQFAEAEGLLFEALNKNNNDPDTIANLLVCADATGKSSDVINRYISQLHDVAQDHAALQDRSLKETLFDRCAQRFQI